MAKRARTVPTLLAARRLTADARPAGRAAAAIGAVALTIGVVAAFTRSILRGNWDPGEYLGPAYLAAACAVAATLVIATSLAVHSAETVLERRREMAALVANGVPASTLVASQRTECLIATVPLAVAGTLFGGFAYGLLDGLDAVMTGYILLRPRRSHSGWSAPSGSRPGCCGRGSWRRSHSSSCARSRQHPTVLTLRGGRSRLVAPHAWGCPELAGQN